jgi:hypothetical protein
VLALDFGRSGVATWLQKVGCWHMASEGRVLVYLWIDPRFSSQEAERTQTDETKERVEVAVLAVEKPQENVRESFNGGQNGRFLPAPKLLYNLFRKDDRPKEDKSWLDRVTDSIIDKLELRWEDEEEARVEARSPPPFPQSISFANYDRLQLTVSNRTSLDPDNFLAFRTCSVSGKGGQDNPPG